MSNANSPIVQTLMHLINKDFLEIITNRWVAHSRCRLAFPVFCHCHPSMWFLVLILMWEKMIPRYRLWLHGLYGLHGSRCPPSKKGFNSQQNLYGKTTPQNGLKWKVVSWEVKQLKSQGNFSEKTTFKVFLNGRWSHMRGKNNLVHIETCMERLPSMWS